MKRLTPAVQRIFASSRVHGLRQSSSLSAEKEQKFMSTPDKEVLVKASVQPVVLKEFISPALQEEDKFGLGKLFTVEDMFNARLHYGHKRLGVCVFDLEITKKYLERALNFVAHVAMRGGIILFVTSNRATIFDVERAAQEVGQFSHTRKWLQGTLTNTKQLIGSSVRLPDTIIFLSTLTSMGASHPAIIEAAKMGIPTVGVVDTNSDPAYLTYLVPANDDTPESAGFLLRLFKEAILRGQQARNNSD
ncbi:unnamed protein product [Auanema sp. JU1783]|nr:unnamed protein product [Auanema sp. JU1783]